MTESALTALLFALGYLVGSFPTGLLVARAHGVDIRKVGSGNIGATNVGRALGRKWSAFVLLVDAGKGFLPLFAARAIFHMQPRAAAVVGFSGVAGHAFSIFLRGRGGKSVATSLGVAMALSAPAALASFAIYVVLLLVTHISSIGSLVAVTSFPVALYAFGEREPAFIILAAAMAVLVIARHKDNIHRLLRGEEHQG